MQPIRRLTVSSNSEACSIRKLIVDSSHSFADSLLPLWTEFPLHPLIKRGLHKLGFTDPTEIQKRAIPVALQSGKDVVGVAETVSNARFSCNADVDLLARAC